MSSRVVLVTARWGAGHGESGAHRPPSRWRALVARARRGRVALQPAPRCPLVRRSRTRRDSVFTVHEIPAARAEPRTCRLAAGRARAGSRGPTARGRGRTPCRAWRGPARRAAELVASLKAGAVVLAGPETWWLPEALGSGAAGPRVVSVPSSATTRRRALPVRSAFSKVDAVGVLSGPRPVVSPTGPGSQTGRSRRPDAGVYRARGRPPSTGRPPPSSWSGCRTSAASSSS